MPDKTEDQDQQERYKPADPYTRSEVGGILERAFQREGGHEPNELEAQRLLALADEAELRAESAEQLSREAEQTATQAAERYALTGARDDLETLQRRQVEAHAYRREAEAMRLEVERLRSYLL